MACWDFHSVDVRGRMMGEVCGERCVCGVWRNGFRGDGMIGESGGDGRLNTMGEVPERDGWWDVYIWLWGTRRRRVDSTLASPLLLEGALSCAFRCKYKVDVCAAEGTPTDASSDPLRSAILSNFTNFDGISHGLPSSFLSLTLPFPIFSPYPANRLHVLGGKFTNITTPAHAKPINITVKINTSRP